MKSIFEKIPIFLKQNSLILSAYPNKLKESVEAIFEEKSNNKSQYCLLLDHKKLFTSFSA